MTATVSENTSRLGDWLGLIRFSHTIFALPFAGLALIMALATPMPSGQPPAFRVRDGVGVLMCMVFARSAAMAFNRLADHRLDAANPRTASRHLPAGILGRRQVWMFTIACGFGFVLSTAIFLPNGVPVFASVPVLIFLCGYSYAKRFTSAAHLWLGVALSLSPICVWLAIRGGEAISNPADLIAPTVLACVVAFWVTGFDIIYACQDADFDASSKLHSVPARFGLVNGLRIAAACHAVMLVFLLALIFVGRESGLGWPFGFVWLVVAGLVIRQHRLVRPDDLARVNLAFFDTNAAISVILLVAGAIDCWWV